MLPMAVSLGLSFYVAVLGVAAIYFYDVGGSVEHDAAGHPVTTAPPGESNDSSPNATDHEPSEQHAHSPPYEICFLFGSCVFGGNLYN